MCPKPALPTAANPPADPAPPVLARAYTYRLHRLQKLTDKSMQLAYGAITELPLGEGRCLTAVGAFAPLSVQLLAHAANVDKAQASRAAQSLVEKGLVRKLPDPQDARGVVLSLTPKGKRLCERLMQIVALRNEQIMACLSAAEQATFDGMLDKLVAHAQAVGAAQDASAPRRAQAQRKRERQAG